jgi:hypothetical protein
VDLLAVRKDHGKPIAETKRGDALQIILIQVKGGSAAMPTTEDGKRGLLRSGSMPGTSSLQRGKRDPQCSFSAIGQGRPRDRESGVRWSTWMRFFVDYALQ